MTTSEQRLLRVSRATNSDIKAYRAGVYLEQVEGRTIQDLHQQAAADRMNLADAFLELGDRLMRSRPPMFRAAVSRYYYSMYHAVRSVVYFRAEGDDHEQHSVVPTKMPLDFPQLAYWQNELKDARLRRNEADYNPYPTTDSDFQTAASHLRSESRRLVQDSRAYLQQKGCVHA